MFFDEETAGLIFEISKKLRIGTDAVPDYILRNNDYSSRCFMSGDLRCYFVVDGVEYAANFENFCGIDNLRDLWVYDD